MKKYIKYLVLATVAALVVGVSACGKSDEPSNGADKLVGSWQFSATLAAFNVALGGTYVQLREDGTTVVDVSKTLLDDGEIEMEFEMGTYKRDGNKLVRTDERGSTESAAIKDLTDEKLVLSGVAKNESISLPLELELTRVSDEIVNDWIKKASSHPEKHR